MAKKKPTMQSLNVTPGKQGARLSAERYEAMRKALLQAIPRRKEGIAFRDLPKAVAPLLPEEVFAGASISWYVTTVKLDLEARGLIERIPDMHPQRLRRP